MIIVYLVLTHNNPLQTKRMIEKLTNTNSFFLVHVDKKSNHHIFVKTLEDIANVTFIPPEQATDIKWGHISMVYATLLLLNTARTQFNFDGKGYCILLSGQDYPIKNNEYIQKFFYRNYGINYINFFTLTNWQDGIDRINAYNLHIENRDIFSCYPVVDKRFYRRNQIIQSVKYITKSIIKRQIPNFKMFFFKKRYFPNFLNPYGGSQWWALPFDTIQKILVYLKAHPEYLEYHKFTKHPDEIFFQSIILALIDKGYIENSLTLTDWKRGKGNGSPRTFSYSDFEMLKDSRKLFARKFDMKVDKNILDKIDIELLQSRVKE